MAYYNVTSDIPGYSKTRFTITNIDHKSHNGVKNIYLFCQGHFSSDAADYVSSNLPILILQKLKQKEQPKFENILTSAFKQIQKDMMESWSKTWPKLEDGHNSLSGTSVTVALLTNESQLVIGHVGGSTLFFTEFNQIFKEAEITKLTTDHSLTNPDEMMNIFQKWDSLMDNIATKPETDEMATAGESCFVWDKTKCICQPNAKSTQLNPEEGTCVPMISLTRTLGDYWCYRNDNIDNRVISYEPSVTNTHLKEPFFTNYLVFVTRKLSSLITEDEISNAVIMKEKGLIQDPAQHLLMIAMQRAGAGNIQQISVRNFGNMSVLLVPLPERSVSNSSENTKEKLQQPWVI